jgi:hypothetical protein
MLPPFSRELQASRFSVGPIQNPSCWECRSRPKLSSPALMCPPPRNPPRLSSAQAQNMASKTEASTSKEGQIFHILLCWYGFGRSNPEFQLPPIRVQPPWDRARLARIPGKAHHRGLCGQDVRGPKGSHPSPFFGDSQQARQSSPGILRRVVRLVHFLSPTSRMTAYSPGGASRAMPRPIGGALCA